MKLSFTGLNVALVLLLMPGIARADDPNLGQIIGISELGSYAAINNSGQSSGDVNPSNYGLNSNNTFGVNYNNDKGMIRGSARCSTVDGGGGLQTEIPDQTGQSGADNCYCSFFDYTPSGGSAQSFLSNPWVFVPVVDCANNCADNCGRVFAKFDENIGMSNTISIRSGMFNAYTPSSSASGDAITTRTYVDNLLNTKQAKITTTGTNKLMTYGASTGAAPGSRDIVSTLGTSTTATTVPEVGPIVTGLNGKQNTVNGTANYVMTGTGTAGTLGEKPVYSATTNYTNALVTAQTINTAATNAANGEMSCNTYVENAAQTPANCLLWQIVQSAPTGLALASTNPDLMTLIGASSAGSEYAARDNNGEDMNDNASTYGLSSSDHNSFAVDYGSGGVVRGHGRCSTRAGDSGTWDNDTYNVISSNFVDSLTDETGQTGAQYCYCGLDSYTPQNGSAQSLSGPWVFDGVFRGAGDCADLCADFCASYLLAGSDLLAFRSAVFNAYAPSSSASGDAITTRTYVDNLLSGKQARITTTGTNKLMTFGSSAGNIGTKDIVSTLGTSTTATTVPEVGPIVTGLNGKQNTVNGTANYVMTGTGTAGTLGEKPVYSTTNNYTNALVTAQTINTAAATAANSELSCIDNDCLLWQINTSGPTGISTRIYLNASINGTSTCYRKLNGGAGSNGTCGADTLSYLGADRNKSGKWGVVFPYGDVSGISVCSTQSGTANTAATSEQSAILDGEYTQQTRNGSLASNQTYCWCKMENPVASPWVFGLGFSSASGCASSCAINCGTIVQYEVVKRRALFGI